MTKKQSTNIKERLGKRVTVVNKPTGADIPRISGTPLYSEIVEEQMRANIYDRLGPNRQPVKDLSPPPPSSSRTESTMVADNVSRHSDVHARLKKQGVSLPTTPRGPLGKRLGQHAVFGRLE